MTATAIGIEGKALFSAKEICTYIGCKPTHFYTKIRQQLPDPVRLGERRVVWKKTDIDAFIEQQQGK